MENLMVPSHDHNDNLKNEVTGVEPENMGIKLCGRKSGVSKGRLSMNPQNCQNGEVVIILDDVGIDDSLLIAHLEEIKATYKCTSKFWSVVQEGKDAVESEEDEGS